MLASGRENARLQSDFYRNKFRRTLRWLFYLVILMFFLIIIAIYLVLVRPEQQYFANTAEGNILPMPPPMTKG